MTTGVQVCRTCLAYDTRMFTITNTPVQKYYEDITKIALKTEEGRPSAVCYICYHLLKKCHRFAESAVKANDVLEQICKSGIQVTEQDKKMLDKGLLKFSTTPITFVNTSEVSENIEIPNIKYENFEIKMENDENNISPLEFSEEAYLEMEVPAIFQIKKEEIEEEDADALYHSSGSDDDVPVQSMCAPVSKKLEVKKNTKSAGTVVKLEAELFPNEEIERNSINHAVFQHGDKEQSSIIHIENEIDQTLNPSEENDEKKCNFCGKRFIYKSLLTRHLRMHTGEKPFPCNYCDKKFTLSNGLVQHVKRIHTGEKPYICKECGKNFLQKSILTRHLRVHTGEKPFACNYCGKSYTIKLKLKHHIRMHTGERPYACNLCELRFTEKYLLTRHLRRHL